MCCDRARARSPRSQRSHRVLGAAHRASIDRRERVPSAQARPARGSPWRKTPPRRAHSRTELVAEWRVADTAEPARVVAGSLDWRRAGVAGAQAVRHASADDKFHPPKPRRHRSRKYFFMLFDRFQQCQPVDGGGQMEWGLRGGEIPARRHGRRARATHLVCHAHSRRFFGRARHTPRAARTYPTAPATRASPR